MTNPRRQVLLVLALAGAAVWGLAPPSAGAGLSIKEIMDRAHRGPRSLLAVLGKELKASPADWPDIQKNTTELVSLGEALDRHEPEKGASASWHRLTRAYLGVATQLRDSAGRQDRPASLTAHKKLISTCNGCHNLHKP